MRLRGRLQQGPGACRAGPRVQPEMPVQLLPPAAALAPGPTSLAIVRPSRRARSPRHLASPAPPRAVAPARRSGADCRSSHPLNSPRFLSRLNATPGPFKSVDARGRHGRRLGYTRMETQMEAAGAVLGRRRWDW